MTARSADHLKRLVEERHTDVLQKLDGLILALAENDRGAVQEANAKLSKSLHTLGSVIAKPDWPSWLGELVGHVDNYKNNHSNGLGTWKAHLLTLMRELPKAQTHVWFLVDDESGAADFDIDQIVENAFTMFVSI